MIARILVVEDEAIAGMAISLMLENSGFGVLGVIASGEEAVRLSDELSPDVVLMDVRLRGKMSGTEAARIIQSHRNIPVIFTTAYSIDEICEHHAATGSILVLTKPITEDELVRTVHTALGTAMQ